MLNFSYFLSIFWLLDPDKLTLLSPDPKRIWTQNTRLNSAVLKACLYLALKDPTHIFIFSTVVQRYFTHCAVCLFMRQSEGGLWVLC